MVHALRHAVALVAGSVTHGSILARHRLPNLSGFSVWLAFFRRYGDNNRRTSYAVHLWEIQGYTVSSCNLVGQKFVAHAWPFCAWARCAAHLASVTIAVVRSVAMTVKRYATYLVPKFSHARIALPSSRYAGLKLYHSLHGAPRMRKVRSGGLE